MPSKRVLSCLLAASAFLAMAAPARAEFHYVQEPMTTPMMAPPPAPTELPAPSEVPQTLPPNTLAPPVPLMQPPAAVPAPQPPAYEPPNIVMEPPPANGAEEVKPLYPNPIPPYSHTIQPPPAPEETPWYKKILHFFEDLSSGRTYDSEGPDSRQRYEMKTSMDRKDVQKGD